MPEAKIRHIAVCAEDQDRLAEFYKSTFGMREVGRGTSNTGVQAIYLSDGYINLAVLPASGEGRQEGLYHFGFEVEDAAAVGTVAEQQGATVTTRPADGRFAEWRVIDPVGTQLDISSRGWAV